MTGKRRYHDSIDPGRRLRMLDNEGRGKWLRVNDLIKELNVNKGMTCIDLGCGAGALSFSLAEAVGREGTVYAVDTNTDAINRIREKNPPENLITINSSADRTGLDDGIADVCFTIMLLHEVDRPEDILAEAYRLLKPGGRIAAIEWKYEAEIPGPPPSERISREQAEQLFNQAGYREHLYKDWTQNLYLFTGTKADSA